MLLAMLMIAPLASPASARIDYVREVPANNPYGPNTDIVISRLGEGQSLTGALPPVGTTWPVASYPTSIPSGYQTNNPGFAGVIVTEDINGETTAPMYCIDIRTETRVGIGYENGTWDEATVPNIGYVNRILNSYYPIVTEPEDGSSESVTVQTTLPEPVAVAAGSTVDLTVTNAYTAVPAPTPTPTPAPTPAPEKPERPEKPGKSGKLPKTGSDGTALAVSAGVGALGLGGLLLLAAKRRRGSGEDL